MKIRFSDWLILLTISDITDRRYYLSPDNCGFTPALIFIAFMCGGKASYQTWGFWFEKEDQLLHFAWLTGVVGEFGFIPF